jgi:hypothetical protein
MTGEQCPHCGRTFAILAQHMLHCVYDPAVWRATRAALDDGTGAIKREKIYRAGKTPVSNTTLRTQVGSWYDVAKMFKLRWYRDDMDAPEDKHERWRYLLESTGFKICRVREVMENGRALLYMEIR